MTTEVFRPKRKRTKYMPPPQSLANLRPYKPGENGHGRVSPLKERIMHALDKPTSFLDEAPTSIGDAVVKITLKGALNLVPPAFHETWDRVEGKVADPIPPGYQDNRTINIIVSSEKAKELTEKLIKGYE
jgi:hypothetical protein